ncbi:MAG: transposase, partial [Campylobacterales bacterium]|nr:transposase [Campylobacterales bacterium]
QQMHDLTDEEAIAQLAFNLEWHYALDITDESDEAKYMSLKTLWNFRNKIIAKGLDVEIFDIVTGKLAEVFKVDTSKQRLDSVHIRSNMKRLGRINIFARSIHGFLVNLKRHHIEAFDLLPEGYKEKYMTDKAMGCFSMVKPTESEKTLKELSVDLYELVERFKMDEKITSMTTYKLMRRVLTEQCVAKEGEDDSPIEVSMKPAKEVSSDSLQNPSDHDASYDGHKGQGYQVQVMETYSRGETGEEKPLNLITYVKVEPAHESDTKALIPAIESVTARGLKPDEILADSLYGSDDNIEAAQAVGIEVVAPVMGQPKDEALSIADFEKTDAGAISKCPEGHMPLKTKIKGSKHIAHFDRKHCSSCLRLEVCLIKRGKRRYSVLYDKKQVRLAERRKYESTDEFKDRYRYRSGVESTISTYDRITGVKRLRVRGLQAVRFCAVLKAAGVNIFRATAYRGRVIRAKEAAEGDVLVVLLDVVGISRFWEADLQYMRRIDGFYAANSELALAAAA